MTVHAVSLRRAVRIKFAAMSLNCVFAIAGAIMQAVPAKAQGAATDCTTSPQFQNPPEIQYSSDGTLRGTINLTEQFIPMPRPGDTNCSPRAPQIVRIFQGFQGNVVPPSPSPDQPPTLNDPAPGPTLRGRVGGIVQLSFINQVNQNNFDRDIDLEKCTNVGPLDANGNGTIYPVGAGDVWPDCLHASSTANIHFHGIHTSPKSTGDNVLVQIRPFPRDRLGNLTTKPGDVTEPFKVFFDLCSEQLKNPLNQWPARWDDLARPQVGKYLEMQIELLRAYQAQNPTQPLWDLTEKALRGDAWPQFYIGAYPYCFALPDSTQSWPPPPGSTLPIMGQSPGTHWYHAHKHGATAINVGNGMVGAFIVEGPSYDGALNAFYGTDWTRTQPIMVLNQLQTVPNRLNGVGGAAPDFVVNGRRQPEVTMRPGEVQLWRIVNGAGRSAAYFQAPEGFHWRQIAQDGVQFANENYVLSEDRPIYMAPGNRIDLLVQAPVNPTPANQPLKVLIQNVMARANVLPIPAKPSGTDPDPTTVLLTVALKGTAVQPPMPFIPSAPTPPAFLADVADWELSPPNPKASPLTFDSKPPKTPAQHTINGIQFTDQNDSATVPVPFADPPRWTAQEWTIRNTTNGTSGPGLIDHPFHIHINPFQITEVFDPNESLVDDKGRIKGQVVQVNNSGKVVSKTVAIPKYVVLPNRQAAQPTSLATGQCIIYQDDPTSWTPKSCPPSPAGAGPSPAAGSNLVWWDVFAIPSGRAVPTSDPSNPTIVPGYFKMRSRFVDYQGLYVLHCHILIHEDRGMMFLVNVGNNPGIDLVRHH